MKEAKLAMKTEIATAIIAAIVAVISAIVSIYGQTRVAKLAAQLAKQHEAESREAQAAVLRSRYRDPLLRAAIDLQSRLFNILGRNFFGAFYHGSAFERDYAIQNTLYVVAEYFGWVEVLRREIQFLDLGDVGTNRQLNDLFVGVTTAFGTNRFEPLFRIFNGEQRAIGEIMLVPRPTGNSIGYECIGYASFVKKLGDPEFARWFAKLKEDIENLANAKIENVQIDDERMVLIHSKLIDLIDFLDPTYIYLSRESRTRIRRHQ